MFTFKTYCEFFSLFKIYIIFHLFVDLLIVLWKHNDVIG